MRDGSATVCAARSEKRATRKNNAYKAQRDLFAFNFINVARTNNELAKIRKFINGQDGCISTCISAILPWRPRLARYSATAL